MSDVIKLTESEVVKAETPREAIELAKWCTGDLARVASVRAIANSDGTWTVIPVFELVEKVHTDERTISRSGDADEV